MSAAVAAAKRNLLEAIERYELAVRRDISEQIARTTAERLVDGDTRPHGHRISAGRDVLSAIKQRPGMRGVEVVALIGTLQERTVRTALHRLKMAGDIRTDNGRWFPNTPAAPAAAPPA